MLAVLIRPPQHDFGGLFGFSVAWGVAISVVATLQLAVALALGFAYDHWDVRVVRLGPLYPLLFWMVSALAALRSQLAALLPRAREQRVVWDIPREQVDARPG